ncbi:MAG: hypothetical protein L0H84_15275, partial [Pseudonocardia sp.]|nr:hypothetical protein [Pseudonocardia sp.]
GGRSAAPPPWLFAVVDAGILAVILWFSTLLWRHGIDADRRVRAWWFAGAAGGLAVDLVGGLLLPYDVVWIVVTEALIYIVFLAIMIASTLGATPRNILTSAGRRAGGSLPWIRFRSTIPLLVGTIAAYAGSIAWTFQLDTPTAPGGDPGVLRTRADAVEFVSSRPELLDGLRPSEQYAFIDSLCSGAISPQYFTQLSAVIPLLLVALVFEARFVDQLRLHAVGRAVAIGTILFLGVGEALALSALPQANQGCGHVLGFWHEYVAFVLTLEASFIGLTGIVAAVASSAFENIER